MGCKLPSPGSQPACPATPERPAADALGFRPAEHRTSPGPFGFSPVSLKASGSGDGVGPAEAHPLQTGPSPPGCKPYVLELFCGTAGVSAAMQKRGCEALGMDQAEASVREGVGCACGLA